MGKSVIVAGIGSRKGVSKDEVLAAIDAALAAHGLGRAALAALATTDFKRGETGIFEAAQALGLELRVVATPLPAGRDTTCTPPPPRPEDALDTSPPLREVEDRPAARTAPIRDPHAASLTTSTIETGATPIPHPAQRGGGAEPSGLAFGKPEDRLREAEGGSGSTADASIPRGHLNYKASSTPTSPSPLWGGVRGGGARVSQSTQSVRAQSVDVSSPPPLTPPHKGEGVANAPANPFAAEAQRQSRSSPRRGEGGRAEQRPGEGECGPEPTTLSFKLAGTPSVSETAALGAAGKGARLLGPRIATGRVTCALATSEPSP